MIYEIIVKSMNHFMKMTNYADRYVCLDKIKKPYAKHILLCNSKENNKFIKLSMIEKL